MHVFISYKRDDEDFARRLTGDLQKFGLKCWLDVNEIHAGADWTDAINHALQECLLMIVVITPESMLSREVSSEWKFFRMKEKPIIPLLLREADNIHFQLATLQYVDFATEDYDVAFEALRKQIARKLQPILRPKQTPVQAESTAIEDTDETAEMPRERVGRPMVTGKLVLPDSVDDAPETTQKSVLLANINKKHETTQMDGVELDKEEEKLYFFDAATSIVLSRVGQTASFVRVELNEGEQLVIGRKDGYSPIDVDLTPLGAVDGGVSRRHAELSAENNRVFIKDMRSTNGTNVNNQRLHPFEKRAIKNGDWILLGELLLRVRFMQLD